MPVNLLPTLSAEDRFSGDNGTGYKLAQFLNHFVASQIYFYWQHGLLSVGREPISFLKDLYTQIFPEI